MKLAKLVTILTALEPALLVPLLLMMLGQDSYASLAAVAMLVLSTLSQIPKRFSFRELGVSVLHAVCFG
eukprot:COSAG01_NODE_1319_length_10746_cov_23.542125_5_plen_69_part_00